ncbi:glycine/betaine ABC transporter ATP-binding protein [Terribacillus saccharophilus]|uniref:Quaternary amine transport ATP-binding protein n=3 Tax=Terribacillus saccharophilus TaxID=361277 RepID=A0A268HA70_9BACI|nr:betaine/proline/choline family ABC transporter ATP-binding protein [Terribacillus saccharophilus]PAD34634.1 glycine/betaine ABC transporter ATP-binding protein [Terribacillus saccharophilus]PAD95382.1 glycine/betaine ABC transporter ATP-binding protein [Terribacillus saccharophilus]PAD98960.1 glycine/betaine ABC transporter ATP-binding protein [Terribacillus saccharophilus]PAE06778.1 glycine/betaine ABC transporter ATP-binding protein [Terribacillus saccharophilus]
MLTFENVTKIYSGSKKAVNNLNLQIEKGEFICFIGPSGCGKTTSMKMVNRLIEPTEGRILIDGKDIMKQNRVQMRREIGYVIQQIGLFPHMTISENITLVPKLLQWSKEKRRERAVELIKLVNLPEEYLDRYPQELSGGQQQRIGVLRALASNPPLILMDEPFGALDPITRDGLQEEFKDLQRRLGKTIVFVTHDMDEAIKLADRIVIMKDGEIVQVDTPDEILRNPANEFVESFIGKERLIQTKPDVTTVGQIMNKIPATVHKEETLSTAIQRMKEKRVDSLLVIGDDQTLEGYIDVEDIEENRKKSTLVGEIYETELYKVKEDSLIRDTIQKMLRRHTKYVPVVDDQNRLRGIVTRATLADLVYDSIWGDEDDN